MKHVLFTASLPDGREVCVSPISLDAYKENQLETLGDDTGYFIYEFDDRHPSAGIEVLAKTASYAAAMRLVDIFTSVQARPSAPA